MRRIRLCLVLPLLAAAGPGAAVLAQAAATTPGLSLLEAVRLTLANDPNVALEEARLDTSRGALAIAASTFDPVVSSAVTESDTRKPDSLASAGESRTLEGSLGWTQKLRSGLSLEPSLSLLQSEDVTAGSAVADTGTLTFRLRQPLLRGRGRAATAAGERAAERELAASAFDLRQAIAQRLLVVVAQYWTVAAAARNLGVLRESEASSRQLLETTRKLIDADQVPAAELVQLEANLAAKESATIGGERALFAARQDLGREIGLDAVAIARLPLPEAPFPAVDAAAVPSPEEAVPLLAEALRRRADLRAAEERREAAEILRRAAENALQPQLDLVFSPAYSGIEEGGGAASLFAPLYHNVPGASAALSLSLSWPTLNRRAQGALVESDAALRQSALAVDLVAKAIGANLPAALDAVGRDARQLDRAREAVRLFERAVVNEEKKLRAGTSTLLDVISQRDRLTAAQQGVAGGELALALSLLQLRFETGTLFEDGGEEAALQLSRLTTLPDVPPEGRP
jgi:outer membrane protein TolC